MQRVLPYEGDPMKRSSWVAVTVSMVVLASACGSGKKIGGGVTPGSTVAPGTPTTSDVCKTTTLTATEVGVSPTTITVTRDRRHRLAAPARPVPRARSTA